MSKILLTITLPFYILDQLTKWLAWNFLSQPDGPHTVTVIPNFFQLVCATNTGAAFGIMPHNNSFFIALSIAALFVLLPLCKIGVFSHSRFSQVGFALIVAGILGNLTDRLARGYVVDFLQFDLHIPGAHPWPSFNVADACICVAAACFIIDTFRPQR